MRSHHIEHKELIRYFVNLISLRPKEYIKAYRPKDNLQLDLQMERIYLSVFKSLSSSGSCSPRNSF